jgi:ABC-type microcin C transport system permease subunit YejE
MSVTYHRISEEGHSSRSTLSSNDDEDEHVLAKQVHRQSSSRLLGLCSHILVCVLSLYVGLVMGRFSGAAHSVDGYLGIL